MKKAEPPSPSPRSARTPGSSSGIRRSHDSSLSMRTLSDNLPDPTPRRSGPPSKVSSRRASLEPQASSRLASLDQSETSTKRNRSYSTVRSLGKQVVRKEGDVLKSRALRASSANEEVKKSARNAKGVDAMAASLPLDSLCVCLEKLESVYHVVTCASVCRHWRDAVRSDAVWKTLYLRWWHLEEEEGASSAFRVPSGFHTWRAAFTSKYSAGKQKIHSEVITHGVNAGWLGVRRSLDRRGKQVRDSMPGDAMRKIAEELGLSFHVQINRDPPVRLRGKASVIYFPGTCLLRYPMKTTKTGLSLRSLKSLKVTATSDKLLRTCTVASFAAIMGGQWDMVSREGPLRLLQQTVKQSMSLVVGTLFEGMHGVDGFSMEEHGEEQVLLVMASLHLSDIIWIMMELGEGATPQFSRRVYHDHMNPLYGLYNWHASVQLHNFGKLLWRQEFRQVFSSPLGSIQGQTAVFSLISSHELFPGSLASPWRTEVFSGELRGVFMLDFTLWDPVMEIAWHCTRAVRTYPAQLATVEYGPPGMDGERMHTGVQDEERGASVSMNLCTPFTDVWGAIHDLENSVVITDLRFSLTSKFLESWFGRSNLR